MIQLHFRIKFRAFGVTLGVIEDTKDISALLLSVFSRLVPPAFLASIPAFGRLSAPVVVYDARGVFIELV